MPVKLESWLNILVLALVVTEWTTLRIEDILYLQTNKSLLINPDFN